MAQCSGSIDGGDRDDGGPDGHAPDFRHRRRGGCKTHGTARPFRWAVNAGCPSHLRRASRAGKSFLLGMDVRRLRGGAVGAGHFPADFAADAPLGLRIRVNPGLRERTVQPPRHSLPSGDWRGVPRSRGFLGYGAAGRQRLGVNRGDRGGRSGRDRPARRRVDRLGRMQRNAQVRNHRRCFLQRAGERIERRTARRRTRWNGGQIPRTGGSGLLYLDDGDFGRRDGVGDGVPVLHQPRQRRGFVGEGPRARVRCPAPAGSEVRHDGTDAAREYAEFLPEWCPGGTGPLSGAKYVEVATSLGRLCG